MAFKQHNFFSIVESFNVDKRSSSVLHDSRAVQQTTIRLEILLYKSKYKHAVIK